MRITLHDSHSDKLKTLASKLNTTPSQLVKGLIDDLFNLECTHSAQDEQLESKEEKL